ncbi:MAG: hypothetical protein AAFY58_07870, partial [Planctomycetota bacterium]
MFTRRFPLQWEADPRDARTQTPPRGRDPEPKPMSEASKANVTSLNRPWVIKTVLITLVLWAFGCWAIYDAVSLYPDRGRAYAEKLELEYLRTLESSGSFRTASTEDPVA